MKLSPADMQMQLQTLGIYNHASMISKAVILQTTLTTNDIQHLF